jgi:dTDP-4-dehydrorhamnose 3,5-epimerase
MRTCLFGAGLTRYAGRIYKKRAQCGYVGGDGEMTDRSGIEGVTVRSFAPIGDMRGALCEIHRDEWALAPRPLQWDFVTTHPRVLRGMHVHRLRWDYVVLLEGHATIGLKDIRRGDESFGRNMVIELTGERPAVVTIPPGVAHGIFAHSALRYLRPDRRVGRHRRGSGLPL